MSDKDAEGMGSVANSLADLLKRGPQGPADEEVPEAPPPDAESAGAEDAGEAEPEAAPRLEVEVIDLEPEDIAEAEPDEPPADAAEVEEPVAAPPPAPVRSPVIRPRTPFAERKPGWLSGSVGGKSPVSGEAAGEAFARALASEPPAKQPAPAKDAPVIDISRLELTFITNDGPVEALADINLTVQRGEFISLIGPSGCGKTTLLRVIADLEKATSGTVLVNGVSAEEARLQRAYGYVFQAPALYPWRTIAKNVALPLEIMGLGVIEREDRIARNLEMVNLTGFERKYPWQLSGGMQQRASIARALAVEPALMLMDEPFGALDEIVRDHLNQQLLELWAETNKTVVFVTHSIPEAVFLSTRIVVMTPRPGKIYDIIELTLPRNRNLDIRETPEFLKIAHRVRQGLRAGHSYDD